MSARPGAARELVPPGARALLLCRYSGLDAPSGDFRLTVSALVRDRRRWRAWPASWTRWRRPGVYHCPTDTAADIVARFLYATGPQDP